MCGRYAITLPPKAMQMLFGFVEQPNFPPRYNIAPSQPVPVVRIDHGERHFTLMRWGLIPGWAKQAPATLLINARAETIAEKPSFRGAFRHRRCLFPADGFYEWQARKGGAKQPYFISRADGKPMAFAGVWETWMPADGSEIDTCAIVTTEANATLRPIHHRMPVVLDEADWEAWLDPTNRADDIAPLLRPSPDDRLTAWPVSTDVNAVANDEAHLIEPIGEPEPQASAKAKSDDQLDLF